jgi:hypothetical protein
MRRAWIRKNLWLAVFGVGILILAGTPGRASPPGRSAPSTSHASPLVVHEWGTFLSVQGSDGVTLGGMVDSEEVLPPFVQTRSISAWKRALMFQKMETPVTYFYTDRPRDVQVRVDMPQGILTHWFPAVRSFGPKPSAPPSPTPGKSYLDWRTVHLIPNAQPASLSLPKIKAEDSWCFARETDAAIVRVRTRNDQGEFRDELEKFLFYRGLGTFPLPLEVRCDSCKLVVWSLMLRNRGPQVLRGMFAIRVDKTDIQFAALSDLEANEEQTVDIRLKLTGKLRLDDGVPQAKSAVAAALVAAGLFPKEAQAMVNTWDKSYFRTEGLRVLYLLPRETVERVIPIQIKPAPEDLVRVMVGRIELLTPERERLIEKWVAELGAKDFRVREAASVGLASLGRLGEPALRRVLAATNDPEVRARADSLIRRHSDSNQGNALKSEF